MKNKLQILFVDDEQLILSGLRRILHACRNQWDLHFALGPTEAMQILDTADIDIIISDIRMPVMNGVELLKVVRDKYPHIVRLALSGQASRDTIYHSVDVVHQYFAKPISPDILKSILSELEETLNILPHRQSKEMISVLSVIPCQYANFQTIHQEITSPSPDMDIIKQAISSDISLTAKIMQLVNAGFFGTRKAIISPREATEMLGSEVLKRMILKESIIHPFDEETMTLLPIQAINNQSYRVYMYCHTIGKCENLDQNIIKNAAMVGFMQNMGKLMLTYLMPIDFINMLKAAKTQNEDIETIVKQHLGYTSRELGAALLSFWGFAHHIVKAIISTHTSPNEDNTFSITALTNIANHLANEQQRETVLSPSSSSALEHIQRLGLKSRVPLWRDKCFSQKI